MKIARERALEQASIPTLLMCLAQITGEDRWLQPPFQPARETQLFGDDTGGLSADLQTTVREATLKMLDALPSAIPDLTTAKLRRMMSVCVGETVGEEYVPMFMEEMGVSNRDVDWMAPHSPSATESFSVLVIGSGVAGIAAAVKLKRLGLNFRILEKNPDLGGTWLENNYPDSGVDTPNHFYSYSFATKGDWSRYFSKRDEILQYLRSVASDNGIADAIEYDTRVVSTTWHEGDKSWNVQAVGPSGEFTFTANAVISAVGQLNQPNEFKFEGLDEFPGEAVHSARWTPELDLSGRRVALVGTGASAIQLLRNVAATADHVTVFQRTPPWVRPNPDYHRTVTAGALWCIENIPHYARWYRFQLFWRFGDSLLPSLRRDFEWPHPQRSINRHNDKHRVQLTTYLESELADRPDLIAKTVPNYPPYAKRILIDNDWFKALRRDNVTLVTDGVERIDGSELVTSTGDRHRADAIIFATGFDAANMLNSVQVTGRNGRDLREVWGTDDPRAYLGITVPEFPNFFCLYGPNTNLAHGGSIIFQVECQIRYITSCLVQMIESDVDSIEVRPDVYAKYNSEIDSAHDQLVWSHPGVTSWYRNSKGRVFSPLPWRLVDYWSMTHDADLSDFDTHHATTSAHAG
ncbi:NAD(P)/FAD-dependent oxidoreductase [Rhodococcus fascians]|nr:NAD(P)/FAD-dependent oxidoreductase [Rhodococcus fascians]MBY4434356.1 NAD(P)/FAD-dependent oxidoreductase [Rhodococcus fascians]